MPRKKHSSETYPHKNFFRQLPAVSVFMFYLGVFLLFAPLPLLVASRVGPERGWGVTIFWLIYSGLIAVLWATARTISPRLLPVAILMTIGISLSWALRWPGALAIPLAAPGLDGVGIVLILIAAYVVFVIFISGEGSRALRMQAELSLARQIHETLAPEIARSSEFLDVLARSDASAEMGGDLIDLVERPAPHAGTDLFLADVSGHGVKAGVVMGMVKSAIHMRLLHAADQNDSLGELLTDLNRVICHVGSPEMFVTFACLRVSRDGRTIEYAMAGHPPILVVRANGSVERLDNSHLPLGVVEDGSYTSSVVDCAPGDTFVLYTDGLTEAMDSNGRELGIAGFERIVASNAGTPLRRMFDAIMEGVRAHSGTAPQGDDQTLLLARLL